MQPIEIERLLVRIEANQRQFTRQMKGMTRQSAKSTTAMQSQFDRTNKRIAAQTRATMQGVKASIASVAAGLGTNQVLAYGDAWTEAGNKIAAASQVAGRQARSLAELNDIADDTRSGITQTVDLYAKLLRSTKDVAQSEEEVARATSIVNKAFKAGGAAASEQAAGILQLGQGLSSGLLQGDELRSLRENAPLIAQAIADEFNTTIGGLKDLGAEGELTAGRVFRAILAAQEPIEAAFSKTNTTIEAGFTRLRNALIQYIGDGDDAISGTERLVSALNFLADNLGLATVAAGALAVRGMTPLAAGLLSRLAPAAVTASTALRLLTVQGGAAIVATSALTRSMALLGGPIGIALFAASGLALALSSTASASEALDESLSSTERTLSEIASISGQLEKDYAELERAQNALTRAQREGGEAAVTAAALEVESVNRRILANKGLREELAILAREQLRDAEDSLKKLENAELASARRRLAGSKGLTGPGVGRAGVGSDLSKQLGLEEQAVRDFIEAERDAAIAASEAGERLDEQQLATIELSKQKGEAKVAVEALAAKVDQLSAGAETVASSLDTAGGAATGFGRDAANAASGVDRLIKLLPRLQQATDVQKKLTEAADARAAALSGLNTGRPEEEAEIARVNALYNETIAELSGLNDALKDQAEAQDEVNTQVAEYLDDSHLRGLDERARRVEQETRAYKDLRNQALETGASLEKLAEIDRAHDRNIAGIIEDTKPSDRNGRLKERLSIEAELRRLASEEVASLTQSRELIGKTASEKAEILARSELIEAVERRRIPLTQTLRDQIDDLARKIGETAGQTEAAIDAEKRRVDAMEESRRKAEELEEATNRANEVLIDGLASAAFQADSVEEALGRVLLKLAEIAASDFIKGAVGLQGGGSSFGNIFASLGGNLFSSAISGGTTGSFGIPFGFRRGGYTGDGPLGEIAGVVHRREGVLNAAATARIGGPPVINALNSGAPLAPSGGGDMIFSPRTEMIVQGSVDQDTWPLIKAELVRRDQTFYGRWRRAQREYSGRVA